MSETPAIMKPRRKPYTVKPCPKCESRAWQRGIGSGPHAARAVCAQCGAFIQWLPKRTG